MYDRIESVIGDISKIDIIVSNHAEMDHSGALPEVIRELAPEKVYASVMGVKALDAHFRIGAALTPVKTGDKVSLGNLSLTFVETKMLHWPDSMFSYLDGEKVLFSQDGFGMHYATANLFAGENDWPTLEREMAKYYANILLPYAPQALKLLADFPKLGLDINVIAPDHGPLWRGDCSETLELYDKWRSRRRFRRRWLFLTHVASTEKMALEIARHPSSGVPCAYCRWMFMTGAIRR